MVSADETAVTYLEIPDKSENDKKHYKYECIYFIYLCPDKLQNVS